MDDVEKTTGIETDASAQEISSAEMETLRSQRIREYALKVLKSDDPLRANVGVINSDLMVMAHALKKLINTAIDKGGDSLEDFTDVVPAIDTYLRLAKTIDRYAQLDVGTTGTS